MAVLRWPLPVGVHVLSVRKGNEEPVVTISMTLPLGVVDLFSQALAYAAVIGRSPKLGARLTALAQEALSDWQARVHTDPWHPRLLGLDAALGVEGSGSHTRTAIRNCADSVPEGCCV